MRSACPGRAARPSRSGRSSRSACARVGRPDPLGVREGWPRGATSDDTAQLLLAAEALIEAPDAPERPFLERLSAALPGIRGAGPTTAAATARYRETGALVAEVGTTNGAMMRAPAVGWAFADADRRREIGERLARATHGGYDAVEGACAIAEMAAAGLEGRLDMGGGWPAPPFSPLAFDARPTLDALVHVLAHQIGRAHV